MNVFTIFVKICFQPKYCIIVGFLLIASVMCLRMVIGILFNRFLVVLDGELMILMNGHINFNCQYMRASARLGHAQLQPALEVSSSVHIGVVSYRYQIIALANTG